MSTFKDRKRFLVIGDWSANAPDVRQMFWPRRSRRVGSSGIWKWILAALHESRSREAARIVARYCHLAQIDAGQAPGSEKLPAKSKSNEPMKWFATATPMLVVAILIFFAVVHGIALQKMHAMDGIDRSTSDPNQRRGD
jgi:hypothetical protein